MKSDIPPVSAGKKKRVARGQVSFQRPDGTERQNMSFSLFSSRLSRGGRRGGVGGCKTGVRRESRGRSNKRERGEVGGRKGGEWGGVGGVSGSFLRMK